MGAVNLNKMTWKCSWSQTNKTKLILKILNHHNSQWVSKNFKISLSHIIINIGLHSYHHAYCNVGKLTTVPFLSTASRWLNNTLHWVSTYPCLREIVPKKMAIHLIWTTFHVGVSVFWSLIAKIKDVIKMWSPFFFSDNRKWAILAVNKKDINTWGCELDINERI